jgi:hypothetical protein
MDRGLAEARPDGLDGLVEMAAHSRHLYVHACGPAPRGTSLYTVGAGTEARPCTGVSALAPPPCLPGCPFPEPMVR